MRVQDGNEGIGASVRRREDLRFLTGRGRYVSDFTQASDYHAAFVRSPHANARIAVDASEARAAQGVVAVFTGADLEADEVGPIPCGWAITGRDGVPAIVPPHPALAIGHVRHVGDPVALVVAESLAVARQAAERVAVSYEPLPAVVSAAAALDPGAPQVWDEAPGNLCLDWELGDAAATDRAFGRAAHVVEIALVNNRLVAAPMEPRAARAGYDRGDGRYTLYTTSQMPHGVRAMLCHQILRVPETALRVVSPDVGGGFGTKIFLYPEETALTWASAKLDRPVAWNAERTESFLMDAQARDHATTARMAFEADGAILGLKVDTVANVGAYLTQGAPAIPTHYYGPLLSGVYRIPAIHVRVRLAFTNTGSVDAYRGAGRPEAAYVLERLMDEAARRLGLDRLALRRRNFIPADAYPYATPLGLTYDSGDHEGTLAKALDAIGFDAFEERRAAARRRGRLRGIGFSTYLEIAGGVPARVFAALGTRGGRPEMADLRVHPSGAVTLHIGTHSEGQGHETTFAQLVADRLGVPLARIQVVQGDTDRVHYGGGSMASRCLVVGGSAVMKALDRVVDKARRIAAHALEAAADDVAFERGIFAVAGTDRRIGFAEVAAMAYAATDLPEEASEPGLEASAFYDPLGWSFPGGCHVCELEIDPDTGAVDILRIVAVDDVGTVVNPMIVEGQIQGGLAQGLGQALMEEAVHDAASGQLLTGSFMDYAMPRADTVPALEVHHHPTWCSTNPLGAKGCAEVGTVGLPPAVVNAALDALAPLGVTRLDMPLTPERVWRAMREV
jgi:carbon-monoxide dehydrogenase large subunit